jgi:hypothetical protein
MDLSKIKKILNDDVHRIFKESWKKHEEHAVGDAKKFLKKSDVLMIATLSIFGVFLITFIDFLIYLRWSTFSTSNPFDTYHPYVPAMLILFNFIFIFCLYAKRVNYWFAYYPAILGIIYYAIEAALIFHLLMPQDLQNFFAMVGLGNPPGWLTGLG